MSCYVVKDEIIADIAESVRYAVSFPNNGICMYLNKRDLAVVLIDCKKGVYNDFDSQKIAEKLYKMNVDAYNGRYRMEEQEETQKQFPKGKNLLLNDIYKLLKELECYLYQCSEDATYNTQLFKALDDFTSSIYRYIVQKSDAYKKAEIY